MKQSFLPKALLFKEWKEHRWWMVVAFALLVIQPLNRIFSILVLQSSPGSGGVGAQGVFWRVLIPIIYGAQIVPNTTGYPLHYVLSPTPYVDAYAGMIAMGLLIALVTVERNRGSLWFTFSGPVRRVDALRVKVVLALGWIGLAWMVRFLTVLSCDLFVGMRVPLHALLVWVGVNVVLELSLMAVGLACATVISTGLPAGMVALLLAGTPWAFGRAILLPVGNPANPTPASNFAYEAPTIASHMSHILRVMSPLSYLSPSTSMGYSRYLSPVFIGTRGHSMGAVIVLWFAIWILAWGWLGYKGYVLAPLENSSRFLIFPKLWPLFSWILIGFLSYLVVNVVFVNHSDSVQVPFVFLSEWLFVWMILGFSVTAGMWFRWRR